MKGSNFAPLFLFNKYLERVELGSLLIGYVKQIITCCQISEVNFYRLLSRESEFILRQTDCFTIGAGQVDLKCSLIFSEKLQMTDAIRWVRKQSHFNPVGGII